MTATATRTGPTAAAPSPRWPRRPSASGTTISPLPTTALASRSRDGLTAERLRSQLEVIAELNGELAPFRILTGIEVDILEDGSLDQDEEILAALDVVVASVHSKLRDGGASDDQAHGGGCGEPAQRHPRPLHGPAPGGQGPRAVELRRRGGVQRLCSDRDGSRDQLAPGETRPSGGAAEARRRRSAAGSASTPTPMRPASSNGSGSAASRLWEPAYLRSRS